MKISMRITGAIVIAALLVAGCGGSEGDASPGKEAAQKEEENINLITIRPEMEPRIKIGQPTMVD
ncbi:MAG: efflux RND transporter periplasmic adaptor subunit, partial [Nitrosospira sp.]